MHEQIQRVETKVNLLMSYESKIQALSDEVAMVHSQLRTPGGNLERQLQNSNVLKNKLTAVQNNLIDGFNRLQTNVQNSLQELNSKVAAMEDGILSILREKQTQISKLSRKQSQLVRVVDTLDQTIAQLSSNDRSLANQSLSNLLTLKIDSIVFAKKEHINETSSKLNDFQSMLHQNDTKFRNSLKQLSNGMDDRINSCKPNQQSQLGRFNRMIQQISNRIEDLSRKLTSSQKSNSSVKERISAVQKQSTESNQQLTQRLQGILKEMLNIKTSLTKDIESVRSQLRSQRKIEMDSKSRNASSGQVTPQQPTISNFEQFGVGVRGLRQQKQKKQQFTASKPKLEPPRQMPSMLNIPKPGRRQLPPVQDDPRYNQKKANTTHTKNKKEILVESDSELEQQFYVNEEGYIVDTEGNLILDKWGQPILYPSDAEDI